MFGKGNYETLIGQRIINARGEVGVISVFNDERVVVRYKDNEATYHWQVAFEKGFVRLEDDSLNQAILDYLRQKAEEANQKEAEIQEKERLRIANQRRIVEELRDLLAQERQIQKALGKNFKLPALKQFVRKNYTLFKRLRSEGYSLPRGTEEALREIMWERKGT